MGLVRAVWLNSMLFSVLAASLLLAADQEAFNQLPQEVADAIERRLHAEEEVVVVDTLRGPSGDNYDSRQLAVFSDFVAAMETKHRDRWVTLCFPPTGVATVDQLAEAEQGRSCAKFPVWLGEEWAPSRATQSNRTLLQETMERLRRNEVHLLNVVGSFCGFSVIFELLQAGIFPRTIVFAAGRSFPHCAEELADVVESIVGYRSFDFETFLQQLGYQTDPLNEILEEAGVPLTIVTAPTPSEFLAVRAKMKLRADIPCLSLSARDELRESALLGLQVSPTALEGGACSSIARVYADEDASVAIDRLYATLPKVCRRRGDGVEMDKEAMVHAFNKNVYAHQNSWRTDRLSLNSKHYCKWYGRALSLHRTSHLRNRSQMRCAFRLFVP